uniref:BTB domain-containing protein n=1 Tax=Bionectria ochroleuca TaxID=29856 RepID=A0A0B7K2K7_BIOOC
MVMKKHELEGTLAEEALMIKAGKLRDENPLDTSPEFHEFLQACRLNDLRKCQELINLGVNINGKDKFDYTPLIIVRFTSYTWAIKKASLCGHYELVQLLLEAGALAERDTFQGERCIYNALNDRIRNLLLKYDFSKSSDPYIYWSTHISSLLNHSLADISLVAGSQSFDLHKFILASRTPYFRKKLESQPETVSWKLSPSIPVEAFRIALRYVYLGTIPRDLAPQNSDVTEEDVLKGLDKISKDLEIERLSVLFPAHKAMLVRSEYFEKMFFGEFLESQPGDTLRVVTVDTTPETLELILTFLYTESTDGITLEHALDLLYAADMLFLDNLKSRAAAAISTLGNGAVTDDSAVEPINVYDVIHAAWDLNVQRLEEFSARYLAYRLEDYIDEDEFQELIRESANRLRSREETDTIELLDDIRYYLSERFRQRFEDTGLDEFMDENGEIDAAAAATIAGQASPNGDATATEDGPEILAAPVNEKGGNGDGALRTIDGKAAEDEFASDAINYQLLLGKIDIMLDRLKLDA